MKNIDVAIIMGSDSDLEVMKEAAILLDEFKIGNEVTIISAHRTPERLYRFAKDARQRGIKVIIAAAGGAAHLPGMTASLTNIPVIGVPIKTKTMDGLDSFLSIAQMPPGVPVATVAINGSRNAAILAMQILAISQDILYKRLEDFKKTLENTVEDKALELGKIGFEKYLTTQKRQK
jgi:5-(carboxyamino)imidazole ribonucleotide mutase